MAQRKIRSENERMERTISDMKDYAEERIHAAQAIRAKLKDEIIPCRLTYSVVEYTEGMDDTQLYTGGEQGFVDFVIRPASGVNAAAEPVIPFHHSLQAE